MLIAGRPSCHLYPSLCAFFGAIATAVAALYCLSHRHLEASGSGDLPNQLRQIHADLKIQRVAIDDSRSLLNDARRLIHGVTKTLGKQPSQTQHNQRPDLPIRPSQKVWAQIHLPVHLTRIWISDFALPALTRRGSEMAMASMPIQHRCVFNQICAAELPLLYGETIAARERSFRAAIRSIHRLRMVYRAG
jgi:hypothetical protein